MELSELLSSKMISLQLQAALEFGNASDHVQLGEDGARGSRGGGTERLAIFGPGLRT